MKKRVSGLVAICMVLCMMMTMVPQTVYVRAAEKMKMNTELKTLYLNKNNKTNTPNTYDFRVVNKGANFGTKYKVTWYADNASIIKVNEYGVVTAKKVGKTKVKCDVIKKSDGKLFTTCEATVTVKANARIVRIKNAPDDYIMKVGSDFDFNATMEAYNGKKATDKTEWVSSDETVLTIDKDGVATAHKPGTVEIKCRAYQSAKHVNWDLRQNPM